MFFRISFHFIGIILIFFDNTISLFWMCDDDKKKNNNNNLTKKFLIINLCFYIKLNVSYPDVIWFWVNLNIKNITHHNVCVWVLNKFPVDIKTTPFKNLIPKLLWLQIVR